MKKYQYKIPKEIKEELEHFKDTGIPRCLVKGCDKEYFKVDEYTWKPSCKHTPNLRLSIG